MALDVPDNNPQYDSDEVLRQIMGQGMFPKAPPDGTNVPMRPSTSAPGQPTVPMADANGVSPQQYPSIPKTAPAPVASAVQPPSIANITPGPVQPRLDNPPQMPPAPPAMDPNAVGANGKSKYRMSIGERIAGTAANFLNGFARNGQAPIFVGRGARNAQWGQDQDLSEQNRKLYETATQGALRQGQIERYEGQAQSYKDRADQAEKNLTEKTEEFKGRMSEKDKEITEKGREADDKLNAQQNKEPQNEVQLATAYQTALMRKDPKAAVYKGALDELRRQKAAGKDTSAADLQKYLQTAEFSMKQRTTIDKEKETERARRYGEIEKTIPKFTDIDGKKTLAAKTDADAKLETDFAPRYADLEKQSEQMKGLTKTGQKVAAGGGAKLSTDEAKSYLTKAGWDGKTAPTPDQKAKARSLAHKDKRSF